MEKTIKIYDAGEVVPVPTGSIVRRVVMACNSDGNWFRAGFDHSLGWWRNLELRECDNRTSDVDKWFYLPEIE